MLCSTFYSFKILKLILQEKDKLRNDRLQWTFEWKKNTKNPKVCEAATLFQPPGRAKVLNK